MRKHKLNVIRQRWNASLFFRVDSPEIAKTFSADYLSIWDHAKKTGGHYKYSQGGFSLAAFEDVKDNGASFIGTST